MEVEYSQKILTWTKNVGPGFNLEPQVVCYVSQTSVKTTDILKPFVAKLNIKVDVLACAHHEPFCTW